MKIIAVLFLCLPSMILAQGTAQEAANKFGTLLTMLDRLYVDSVDTDELVEIAIVKMLEDLDPHSIYF